ncbi:MAG: hypothetical protein AB1646_18655 [Thermodesulfobacteriota bacterium]
MTTLPGHTGSVLSVSMTPNARWAVSGGGWRDQTMPLWDIEADE